MAGARARSSLPFRQMTTSPNIAVIGEYDERNETHRATNAELVAIDVRFAWVSSLAVGDPSRSLGDFDGLSR